MTTTTTATQCDPQPMTVKDLRCGDRIHVNGYFGVTHWTSWGGARPSYPVPGKYHVTQSGQGTHAEYVSLGEIVMVCSTGHCHSSLCGYDHR